MLLGGCFADIDHAELVHCATAQVVWDGSGPRGGEVSAAVGDMGLHAVYGVFGEGLYRTGDPSRHGAGGFFGQGRWSPLGSNRDDHRLERWIDFGLQAGLGGGLVHTVRLEGIGRSWIGGWLELGAGLARGPTLMIEVRSVSYQGYQGYQESFDSATVVSLGLSFMSRRASQGNEVLGAWL